MKAVIGMANKNERPVLPIKGDLGKSQAEQERRKKRRANAIKRHIKVVGGGLPGLGKRR